MAHRYESDRSEKEKWEMEKEKLSKMSFKDKLIYIWTYYKVIFVILILIIIAIDVGMQMYRNFRTVTLLEVGVINSYAEDEDANDKMADQICALLGTGDPYEEVTVDCSYTFGDDMDSIDYNVMTKFNTYVMAGEIDILLCPQFVCDYYKEYDETLFMDLSTLLTEEECEKYGISQGDTGIDVTDLPNYQQYGITSYDPVYLVVISSGKHTDNAVKFIQYLEEGN